MKTTRALTLTALVLMTAACEDVPTFPALEIEPSEATVETAMDLAYVLSQAVVDAGLADVPSDSLTTSPTDSIQPGDRRPDARRPNDRRPDARRPDDRRPDARRPDDRRPDARRPDDRRPDARRPDDRRPDARRPDDRRPDRGRAELAVALSGQAVALATRLLHEQGADEEQKRLLMHAEEQHRKAKAALQEGREALAVELAQSATKTSLKAVVLPGGITEEEARMIHSLAANLLPEAQEAVAANPTALNRHLLKVAEELFRKGSHQVTDAQASTRGVVPLWKSAVISSYLIG